MASSMAGSHLAARHSADMSGAEIIEKHWGYSDRALPCTRGAKTCAYLDLVYLGHDGSMLFSGIFWAAVAAVLLSWAVGRRVWLARRDQRAMAAVVREQDQENAAGGSSSSLAGRRMGLGLRIEKTVASFTRSYLLPDSVRLVFGRTTRLQVLILTLIAAYMFIASFAGLTYRKWVVPVPDHPGVNTIRTTLGPWSNRIGVLAYALTPLTVMLATRESVLSLLTGLPYQSFNFLHHWLGYVILAQGLLHTIAWIVIETKLYAPQPAAALQLVTEPYMIWGIVAILLILLMFVLSLPFVIRRTGYEFFRKAHYVLAMVYIGACYAHWKLLSCFLYSSLLIWALDRGIRLVRSGLVHYQVLPGGSVGFRAVQTSMALFPDAENGDVVRLDFEHSQEAWKIGQHFYLCFARCSIWQSHPFTPLSLPTVSEGGRVQHSYIFRAKGGETRKVAELAQRELAVDPSATTPVILSGSYGESIAEGLSQDVNVLCVAGGTGITYVLPVLLDLVTRPAFNKTRKVQLIWAIRKRSDLQWVQKEFDLVRNAKATHGVQIDIFVTRESSSPSSHTTTINEKTVSPSSEINEIGISSSSASDRSSELGPSSEDHSSKPDLNAMVTNFVQDTISGPTTVFGSGPGGMISDLREVVARCNSGAQVWKGNERFDVSLVCDNRLE